MVRDISRGYEPVINELIEAVHLEQRRIEDPRNRTRYFIFGKIDEREEEDGIIFVFQHAPDRVLRDARYAGPRQEERLFKVGGVFLPGFMTLASNGVAVGFGFEEIAYHDLTPERVARTAESGLEYVMDNRDLNRYLGDFLEARRDVANPLLSEVLVSREAAPIRSVAAVAGYPDLNPSQHRAIEKVLSQRVTFIWGPPGTGKTKTLAAVAASLVAAGKRVLLSALSNMALDQLLLATVDRLGPAAGGISIARTGSHMDPAAEPYSRRAFDAARFAATRKRRAWNGHVEGANLVAANFTMLTYPHGAYPGVFDYVIADEVSMANIPSLVAATYYATTGVAFGGDPFQLPPIYPDDAEIPNDWYRENVFEIAEVRDRHDPRVAFLDTQYRMQKEIGDLVSDLFYGNELKTGTTPQPVLPAFGARVVFIQSSGRVEYSEALAEEVEEERRFNEPHAADVVGAVVSLLGAGVKGSDIGIITPYNAQVVTIAGKLRAVLGDRHKALKQIKVSTVHSFQGQERRAIVVDFTDDNVRPTRLTAKWELINVALSRAKEQLVIVGNRSYITNEEFFDREEIGIFKRMLGHAAIVA